MNAQITILLVLISISFVTSTANAQHLGDPFSVISAHPADFANFQAGQQQFLQVQTLQPPEVLGPLFNSNACAACHDHPAMGGGGLSKDREIRVRNRGDGAPPVQIFAVDNMLRLGPQTQAGTSIDPLGVMSAPTGCPITSPSCELSNCQRQLLEQSSYRPTLPICDTSTRDYTEGDNCITERVSLPLFGDGLVEATDDATFQSIAADQKASSIRGTVKLVTELGATHVGRFGWKGQHATLLGFAEDAYLNEMGIANPGNPAPNTRCAMGVTQYGITLQSSTDPEDQPQDGRADVDRFVDFMRALQPPPRLPEDASAKAGEALFASIGCVGCHVSSIRTSPNPMLPPTTGGVPVSDVVRQSLSSVTFHPFGDFLLHDMGALGDGIKDGAATPTMMRTMPLWGLHLRSAFLHDQRATDLPTAISLHAGQGAKAAAAFNALGQTEQQEVLDFLGTL
jgi:CxxC motif-containing protein (DUF1111 family)